MLPGVLLEELQSSGLSVSLCASWSAAHHWSVVCGSSPWQGIDFVMAEYVDVAAMIGSRRQAEKPVISPAAYAALPPFTMQVGCWLACRAFLTFRSIISVSCISSLREGSSLVMAGHSWLTVAQPACVQAPSKKRKQSMHPVPTDAPFDNGYFASRVPVAGEEELQQVGSLMLQAQFALPAWFQSALQMWILGTAAALSCISYPTISPYYSCSRC